MTINRPPVNSTNEETYNEIRDTFHALDEREDIKVVILTGAGKVFMAGNEMDEAVARHIREVYGLNIGVRTAEDVEVLRQHGVDAVLIGETLMRSPDKKAALTGLRGNRCD